MVVASARLEALAIVEEEERVVEILLMSGKPEPEPVRSARGGMRLLKVSDDEYEEFLAFQKFKASRGSKALF